MRTQLAPDPRGGVQVRAAAAGDCEGIRSLIAGLSPRTQYLRFFAPVSPSPAILRQMCAPRGRIDVLVATDSGVIVGHAMAADIVEPDGRTAADVGLVVADRWQGRGVGSLLFEWLIARAAARGVSALAMDVLQENQRMLAMISRRWAGAGYEYAASAVTVRVRLPHRPEASRGRGEAASRAA